MIEFECLKSIEKEDIPNMSFEELRVLAEEMKKEEWAAHARKEILGILDVRDAESDSNIIDVDFEAK